jgi:serine/threonine protein kinase
VNGLTEPSPIGTCPSPERLAAFLAGHLPPEEGDALAAHVQQCRPCTAAAEAIPEPVDRLASALRGLCGSGPAAGGEPPDGEQAAAAYEPTTRVTAPLEPPAIPDGSRLREYRLGRLLGEGGMGRVYRAVHERLGKTVAVKLVTARPVGGSDAVARFRREVRAAGRLDHPNIVRATDAGEADGVPFLVMEYVPGTDLTRLLDRAPWLPVAAACEVARQAALGLAHAHDHGLVHRDVKPSNLMLTPDGTVKLLDLGLVRWQDVAAGDADATASGTLMGTFNYMAPEQADDPRRAGPRADLYSLGCTLYHLLTGNVPFPAPEFETPYQKMKAHAAAPVPPVRTRRPDVPDGLAATLDRLLAKDPADRMATAAEAAAALAPFAAGADLPGLYAAHAPPPDALADEPPPTAAAAVISPAHRRRWWPWVVAAVALAAAVAWLALDRQPPESSTPPAKAAIAEPILEPLVVTSTADDAEPGKLTLRDAIVRANAAPNDVRIQIGVTGTIGLFRPLPSLTGRLDVTGPGADRLIVRRAATAPEFRVLTVAPSAHVTIRGITLSGGRAPEGGGLLNQGRLTLSRCVVRDDAAAGNGGGISSDGTLELDKAIVADNRSGNQGGGVYSGGRLTMVGAAVCDNAAASHGGGVYTTGDLTASSSTIARNRSNRYGGGLATDGGSCLLTSVTVTANRADADGDGRRDGGGLRVYNLPTLRLYNTIVAGNWAGAGPGRPDDVGVLGGALAGGHNLVGAAQPECGLRDGADGNRVGTPDRPLDARLAPLPDAAGQTWAYAPLPGSPALDRGDNSKAGAADQRGKRRIVNGTVDVGAIEVQSADRP